MDTITIHPHNRISQPTPAHDLAAAIISPLCYRCLLSHRWLVQDGEDEEDILYPIPEIEEGKDEDYVVLNTEEAFPDEDESGLVEVLITIEANVHFEIDSSLAEEEWSIVDEVNIAGVEDFVFVDAGYYDEGESLNTAKTKFPEVEMDDEEGE